MAFIEDTQDIQSNITDEQKVIFKRLYQAYKEYWDKSIIEEPDITKVLTLFYKNTTLNSYVLLIVPDLPIDLGTFTYGTFYGGCIQAPVEYSIEHNTHIRSYSYNSSSDSVSNMDSSYNDTYRPLAIVKIENVLMGNVDIVQNGNVLYTANDLTDLKQEVNPPHEDEIIPPTNNDTSNKDTDELNLKYVNTPFIKPVVKQTRTRETKRSKVM